MHVSNLSVMILIPTVAGLDVGRFYWSNLDVSFVAIGLGFMGISTVLLNWAMIVNPYFEPTVRIQEDQKVITSGPYKLVRHPGYLAGIAFTLLTPLLIGSLVAFITVGSSILMIVIRTWFEDITLQEELKGYSEYAKKTRHRLFPMIW